MDVGWWSEGPFDWLSDLIGLPPTSQLDHHQCKEIMGSVLRAMGAFRRKNNIPMYCYYYNIHSGDMKLHNVNMQFNVLIAVFLFYLNLHTKRSFTRWDENYSRRAEYGPAAFEIFLFLLISS